MRTVRQLGRMLTLLAALAFAGNAVASTFSFGSASPVAIVDPILGPMTICMPADHQDAANGGQTERSGKTGHCDYCRLVVATAFAVTQEFVFITFPTFPVQFPQVLSISTLADHLSLGGVQSRAPPLSA